MDKPSFVYVTLIRAEPEAIWNALTNEAFSRRYWFGCGVQSDWKESSPFALAGEDKTFVEGAVIEAKPYERLAYSWRPVFEAEMAAEEPSKVTFTLEQRSPGVVRLTVVHDGFEPNSKVFPDISTGWPAVLSSLKSILETGEPIPKKDAA